MKQVEKYNRALKNALASARMEGFTVTPDTEETCKKLLSGRLTTVQMVEEVKQKYAHEEAKQA